MRALNNRFPGVSPRPIMHRLRRIFRHDRLHQFFTSIAPPEAADAVAADIHAARLLGTTRDDCLIVLADWYPDSALIREIGRLRELTFRKVGEGTGKRRDLDIYDRHYQHLVVWDRKAQVIAGAYRLCDGRRIINTRGPRGFYTHSLSHFATEMQARLYNGMELGRSFVNPDYQGKASLDYLWQGIGAYLSHFPHVRWLLGPVSMSAQFPAALCAELVYVFSRYYPAGQSLATARIPYRLDEKLSAEFAARYASADAETAMELLQQSFTARQYRIPVLFRQYTSLFEQGGFFALNFSVDPAFGDCVDILCMADLTRLKAKKRRRYIPERTTLADPEADHAIGVFTAATVPLRPFQSSDTTPLTTGGMF